MRFFSLKAIATSFLLMLFLGPAHAIDIKEVTSPGGIKAWLVESRTVPLIAMTFSFEAGAGTDPIGKEGTAHFITGMMDEGAADMDGAAFQARRDELAVKLSFDVGADEFEGSLQTLSKNRDEAFALLTKALTEPHFEKEAMERVRQQFILSALGSEQDPETIVARAWMKQAFGEHTYSRGTEGTSQSFTRITADDLRASHQRIFTRAGLKISVVGDIDAATLAGKLDEIFGALPAGSPVPEVQPAVVKSTPVVEIIERDIPQSIIMFGHGGILRSDPDFIPAFVMSHILGGGGFGSRLTTEVREKRGLTYGVGFGFAPLDQAGLYLGSVSTRNEKAGETLAVVKDTLKQMAEQGPTQAELDDVKTFLTGSYALRFDSNGKIAAQLLGIQQENLGIDYVNKRNGMIDAVTLDQVKAQAKRLIQSDDLIVTVVGKPEGLKETPVGG